MTSNVSVIPSFYLALTVSRLHIACTSFTSVSKLITLASLQKTVLGRFHSISIERFDNAATIQRIELADRSAMLGSAQTSKIL